MASHVIIFPVSGFKAPRACGEPRVNGAKGSLLDMIQQAEEKRVRRAHLMREAVEVILLVAVIFIAIRLSLGTWVVDRQSMLPNYLPGQYVIGNRLSLVFGSPQRGDVVIVNCHIYDSSVPDGFGCIKRVIAIPGDTIEITPTTVSINGHVLNEPYVSVSQSPVVNKWTLKANQYFVMGDNRPVSVDSRYWGPVRKDDILAKVFAVFWPLNNIHGVQTYPDTYKGL